MNINSKTTRAGLNIVAGLIPYGGGFFSALAGHLGEKEQDKINDFLNFQIQMLKDEWKEKEFTFAEITQRLDWQDDIISHKVSSEEFQSLCKKAFRDWGAIGSEDKRKYVRNVLVNSASDNQTGYEIVKLFLDWIQKYSDLHFNIMKIIYNKDGITRYDIWKDLYPNINIPREDSQEADLYKLIIRDLSTGGIIRQYKEVNYRGEFIKNGPTGSKIPNGNSSTMKSAFDNEENYVLTKLGQDFIHFATNEITPKLDYKTD
ncbi:MAG: hypothetical protein LBH40_01845 [Alphaproteobacteria bacterium]|jgi:hypothetical protein|nr:hypothetical protein [Alphaproteobacteria bacterium]